MVSAWHVDDGLCFVAHHTPSQQTVTAFSVQSLVDRIQIRFGNSSL